MKIKANNKIHYLFSCKLASYVSCKAFLLSPDGHIIKIKAIAISGFQRFNTQPRVKCFLAISVKIWLKLGILEELTGQKRSKKYALKPYLKIIEL